MELKKFSLVIKGNELFSDVNVAFRKGIVNHILGKNGTGKTCLAKAIMGAIEYQGTIDCGMQKKCVIGSYTNLPLDLKANDIIRIVHEKFDNNIIKLLTEKLEIMNLPLENKIKHLSDGQRQKLKLLLFLSAKPQLIVLDEFTTALDKKSCLDIYNFINSYSKLNTTIINITHNLTDIEYLTGAYYLIENKSIITNLSKEDVIQYYIRGQVPE